MDNEVDMENEEVEPISKEKRILHRLELKIYRLERDNILSNSKTKSQMIDAIIAIIKEEVKKCY